LNNLRKITDEDERLVTITLLIDIISDLINDRNSHRHHTLPVKYIQEMFHKYSGVMLCLDLIGFKQVRYSFSANQCFSLQIYQELNEYIEHILLSIYKMFDESTRNVKLQYL